jgi:hypothetical protein
MVFPLWVFLISVCILIEKFRGQSDVEQDSLFARFDSWTRFVRLQKQPVPTQGQG